MNSIGGIKRIQIAWVSDSSSWMDLPVGRNNPEVKVVPSETSAGVVYAVSGVLKVARVVVEEGLKEVFSLLKRKHFMLKYEIGDGSVLLVGSEKFPLRARVTELTPGAAAGFVGYQIDITGKQPFGAKLV